MLLTVNVSNSVISFGFFEDDRCEIISSFKISCDQKKTSDEYLATIDGLSRAKGIDKRDINGAIISSVVPQLTHTVKDTVEIFTGCAPLCVGPGVKTGFPIKIDNPSELGGDIVANTAAALRIKNENKCMVVADIDDVNTLSAISKKGEYLGCAILPGLGLSLESLHGNTAQLPNVNFSGADRAIGKNSNESISSGVLFGNAMAVDGFVERFAYEMKVKTDELCLIATGEYADTVLKKSKYSFNVEKHLTLKGLYFIYKNTVKFNDNSQQALL